MYFGVVGLSLHLWLSEVVQFVTSQQCVRDMCVLLVIVVAVVYLSVNALEQTVKQYRTAPRSNVVQH